MATLEAGTKGRQHERLGFLVVSAFYKDTSEMQLVFGCLSRYKYMRDETIARKLGISEKQVVMHTRALCNAGLLLPEKRFKGKHESYTYYYIGYEHLRKVVQYKIFHMRKAAESGDRDKANSRTASSKVYAYECLQCAKKYTAMDIARRGMEGTLCENCKFGEVIEIDTSDTRTDATNLSTALNSQLKTIEDCLRVANQEPVPSVRQLCEQAKELKNDEMIEMTLPPAGAMAEDNTVQEEQTARAEMDFGIALSTSRAPPTPTSRERPRPDAVAVPATAGAVAAVTIKIDPEAGKLPTAHAAVAMPGLVLHLNIKKEPCVDGAGGSVAAEGAAAARPVLHLKKVKKEPQPEAAPTNMESRKRPLEEVAPSTVKVESRAGTDDDNRPSKMPKIKEEAPASDAKPELNPADHTEAAHSSTGSTEQELQAGSAQAVAESDSTSDSDSDSESDDETPTCKVGGQDMDLEQVILKENEYRSSMSEAEFTEYTKAKMRILSAPTPRGR